MRIRILAFAPVCFALFLGPSPCLASLGQGVFLFRPLSADPRESQFRSVFSHFTENRRYGVDITDSASQGGFEHWDGTSWDVATGTTLRLNPAKRLLGIPIPWVRYQVGAPAAIFTYFERGGMELANADYQTGISLDALWSGAYDDSMGVERFDRPVVTSRFLIFHRSSHLGDEYLAFSDFASNQVGRPDQGDLFHHPPVKRVDLSFEALRGVLSVEWDAGGLVGGHPTARLYAGGELKMSILGRVPRNFSSPIGELGIELRSAGNEDDPPETWIGRMVNAPFRRSFFASEWFAAIDLKVAKPYDFASSDNPTGQGEVWTPHLWTDSPYGHEFAHDAGSWHAMAGFILYQGRHRRVSEGGRRIGPEMIVALEWYRGYSPNGQFLDQPFRTRPLAYVVPGLTIHF